MRKKVTEVTCLVYALFNALPSVLEKLTNFRRFSQEKIKVLPQSDATAVV